MTKSSEEEQFWLMQRSRGDAGEGKALLQLEGGRRRLLREEDATSTASVAPFCRGRKSHMDGL